MFHIYPHLDAAEYRNALIGSVVKYPDLPIEGYMPYKASKQPRQIVRSLDPQPIQVKDMKFLTHRMKDACAISLLDGYLEESQGVGAKGRTEARLWHMDSPGKKFQELLKNKAYFKQLIKLLQHCRGYEAYFITDIITLVPGASVPDKPRDDRGQEIKNRLPLPHELDTQNHIQGMKHAPPYFEGETILFLGYSRIRLEKPSGVLAKLTRAFLGETRGIIVRDESDYWPQSTQRPSKENINTSLDDASQRAADRVGDRSVGVSGNHTETARKLGFDIEIVG
ncbi:hypothetical protein E5D57_008141 [Metarhizium anisopliae]|nr:hypothetical protein E5D57_008141 [Metarhizium anisopliae]